jgi:hypothetical protein
MVEVDYIELEGRKFSKSRRIGKSKKGSQGRYELARLAIVCLVPLEDS